MTQSGAAPEPDCQGAETARAGDRAAGAGAETPLDPATTALPVDPEA